MVRFAWTVGGLLIVHCLPTLAISEHRAGPQALFRREAIEADDAPLAVQLSALQGAKEGLFKEQRSVRSYHKNWIYSDEHKIDVRLNQIKIFCFAWTGHRKKDELFLPETKKQFAKCDDHLFFTDKDAPGPDDPKIVKVPVINQKNAEPLRRNRTGHDWLYHKNAAGLMPAWTYMFQQGILDKHDWIINSELDHFMRPSQVRRAIAEYLKNLWNGTASEANDVGGPMLLQFGNAYAFNIEFANEMKRQWSTLGDLHPEDSKYGGCPKWFMSSNPGDCSQDEVFPAMPFVMKPQLRAYGTSGCGQRAFNRKGKPFLADGLACWEMAQSPAGDDGGEQHQLTAIRELAALPLDHAILLQDHEVVNESWAAPSRARPAARPSKWDIYYPNRGVPFIHHVNHPSVLKLARELLGL